MKTSTSSLSKLLSAAALLSVGLAYPSNVHAVNYTLNDGDNITSPITLSTGYSGNIHDTFTVDSGTGTISGIISGNNASIVKRGDGTLKLTGENTFAGSIHLNGGTIEIGSDTALGSAGLTSQGNGVTLRVSEDRTFSNAITVIGTLTIDIAQDKVFTYSGSSGNRIFTNSTSSNSVLFTPGGTFVIADSLGTERVWLNSDVDFSPLKQLIIRNNNAGGIGSNENITIGDHAIISNNKSYWEGAGIQNRGSQLTIGSYAQITDNHSANSGGAIGFMFNSYYLNSHSVTIGAHSIISGNTAEAGSTYGGKGGAILSRTVSLHGDTRVENNTAYCNWSLAAGGAIFAQNVNLDTVDGDILFAGNIHYARIGSSWTYAPQPNAIALNGGLLNISGSGNVYFDDPISSFGGDNSNNKTAGNSLTINSSGFAQFKGANILNDDNISGGAISIQKGTLRIVKDASFRSDSTGFVAKPLVSGDNVTLAGGGTISAQHGFAIGGANGGTATISPDNDIFDSRIHFGSAAPAIAQGNRIGTLTLNSQSGGVALDHVTLNIDFDNGSHDRIITNGAVTIGNTDGNNVLNLDIAGWKSGTYDIVSGTSLSNDAASTFDAVNITGLALVRQHAELMQGVSVLNHFQQALQIKLYETGNFVGTWTGSSSGTWDEAGTRNWANGDDNYFLGGDVANFGGTAATPAIITIRENGVGVAGMFVSGTQDYVFAGGSIVVGETESTLGGTAAANGKLVLGGKANADGTVAPNAFSGTVDLTGITGANKFSGGVDILGGTLRISQAAQLNTGASPIKLGNTTGSIPATLQIVERDVLLTQNFVLEGAAKMEARTGASLTLNGQVAVANGKTASLTLSGKTTFNNTASVNGGTTILAGADVTANRTFIGDITNFGTLNATRIEGSLNGKTASSLSLGASGLTITGNASLDGTTLALAPTFGTLDITGSLGYGTGGVNRVYLESFRGGIFDLISAGNAIDPTKFTLDTVYNQQRQSALLRLKDGDSSTLQLVAGADDSQRMTWTGASGSTWNRSASCWNCHQGIDTFADGDIVVFNNTPSQQAIALNSAMTVSGMEVTGGQYTFSGESISGTTNAATGTLITPTGKLTVSGKDTRATFLNNISFDQGVEIKKQAKADFGKVTGSVHNEGSVNAQSITGNVVNKGSLILATYKLDANGNPIGITTGNGNTITQGSSGAISISTAGGSSYGCTLTSSSTYYSMGTLTTAGTGTIKVVNDASLSGTAVISSGSLVLNTGGAVMMITSNATLQFSGAISNMAKLVLNLSNADGYIIPSLKIADSNGDTTFVTSGSSYDAERYTFTQPDGTIISIANTNSINTSNVSTASLLRNSSSLSAPNKGILGDVTNDGVIIARSIEGKVSNNQTLIADTVTGEVTTGARSTTSITDQSGDVTNAGLFNMTRIRGNVTNQRTGTLKLVGDYSYFVIGGNVENNGHLDFVNAGRTLIVAGDLSSASGATYTMDVDPSGLTASDMLVVDGNISGTHRFGLRFSGNPNTITRQSAAGLIIEAPNNTVGDENVSGKVNAGIYQFSLTPSSASPGGYELLATGYAPSSQAIINTTGAIATGWFSQLDNLLKRMGELRLSGAELSSGDAWLRGYGQQTNNDLGIQGMSDFKEYQYGADLGADWGFAFDPFNTFVGGAFIGYQGATRRFHDGYGSKGTTDSVYGGLYATWMHVDGWYADSVVKAQRFHNSYDANTDQGVFDNYGLGASLEFGKQFAFDEGWFAEPSVQFAYTHIFSESYSTRDSLRVTNGDSDIYRFAGTVRAGKTIGLGEGSSLQPYAKIGIEEQISSGGSVRIADQRFKPTTDGTRGIVGVGIIWQLCPMQQIHFDYEAGWGDKYDKPWGINAGYRLRF